jgi:exosome complex exonuclease RRP6
MVLDVHLDKFFAVADWRIRPLPDGMFDYARSDSHFLIPIYLILMNLLSHNGLSSLCMTDALSKSEQDLSNNYL